MLFRSCAHRSHQRDASGVFLQMEGSGARFCSEYVREATTATSETRQGSFCTLGPHVRPCASVFEKTFPSTRIQLEEVWLMRAHTLVWFMRVLISGTIRIVFIYCLLHPMCFKVLADNPDISNQNKLEELMIKKCIEYGCIFCILLSFSI